MSFSFFILFLLPGTSSGEEAGDNARFFVIPESYCLRYKSVKQNGWIHGDPSDLDDSRKTSVIIQRFDGWIDDRYYKDSVMQKGLQKIDGIWYLLDKNTGESTGETGSNIYLGMFSKDSGSPQDQTFFSLNGKDFHRIKNGVMKGDNAGEYTYSIVTDAEDGNAFNVYKQESSDSYGTFTEVEEFTIDTEGYTVHQGSVRIVKDVRVEESIQDLYNEGGAYKEVKGFAETFYNGSKVWYKTTFYAPELYQTTLKNEVGESLELPTSMAAKVSSDYVINAGTSQHYPVFSQNGWTKENYTYDRPWYDTIMLRRNKLVYYENGTDINILKAQEPTWCVGGFDPLIVNGKKRSDIIDEPEYDHQSYIKTVMNKNPRTFIGQLYNGEFFFGVVAGRGKDEDSRGFNYEDLYDFVTEEIAPLSNIRLLYNLDGGGTSAFIYKGVKLNDNYTDDGLERPCNSVFVFRD